MSARALKIAEETVVEERIARIESDVEHIKSDVTGIKVELGELNRQVDRIGEATNARFDRLLESMNARFDKLTRDIFSTKIWMLMIAAALLGVMARGFKWL